MSIFGRDYCRAMQSIGGISVHSRDKRGNTKYILLKEMRSLFLCFLVLSLFTACSPEEETPEKLILGNYRLNKSESLSFINDSIAIHYFFLNDEKCEDTLGYEYRAPLNIVNVVNTGDVFFKTLINPSTELSIYSRNFNYDETHLYHTIRYGSDMLLPNPESTDFCYVLSDE